MASNHSPETILTVSGMTCDGCARSVTRILSDVPGVTDAAVDLSTGRAVVHGDVAPATLVAAVEAGGFDAHVKN